MKRPNNAGKHGMQKVMSKFSFQFESNGRNYPATAEHVGDHTIVTYNAGTTKFSGQITVDQASDAMQLYMKMDDLNYQGLRYVSPEVGYVDQDEEYY